MIAYLFPQATMLTSRWERIGYGATKLPLAMDISFRTTNYGAGDRIHTTDQNRTFARRMIPWCV